MSAFESIVFWYVLSGMGFTAYRYTSSDTMIRMSLGLEQIRTMIDAAMDQIEPEARRKRLHAISWAMVWLGVSFAWFESVALWPRYAVRIFR